jgi:hypothetical protein
MIFTSNDKLHAKTAPLFMRPDQVFVPGTELKADLQRLDEYFSAQPQEVLDRGVMFFDPPFEGDYLATKLWKQFLPGWRKRGAQSDVKVDRAAEKKLIAEFREASEAPAAAAPVDPESANFIMIKRSVPVKLGKWRIIAQDVAERSWAAEAAEAKSREKSESETSAKEEGSRDEQ